MLTLFISRALPKVDGVGGSARIVPPAEALAPEPGILRAAVARGPVRDRVYAVIDTRTMTAEIAGAGHPAAIVTGEDRLGRIESEGPLLGVFPDAEFESETVELGRTRAWSMFTDGFETAFPDAKAGASNLKMPTDFYIERLARLATNAGDAERLGEALSAFEGELDAQMGSLHRPDDVTALIVGADRAAGRASGGGTVPRAA
jgi:hypothetical protein